MHKSRLTSIVIDCPTASFQQAAEFWGSAFGKAVVRHVHGDARFAVLNGRFGASGGPYVGLQQVSHGPSVHLDIETDDIGAEVIRLEKLGASVREHVRRHVVMQSPSGHGFCVVPVARTDFPMGAMT